MEWLKSTYQDEYNRYLRRPKDRRETLKNILAGLTTACGIVVLAIIMLLAG